MKHRTFFLIFTSIFLGALAGWWSGETRMVGGVPLVKIFTLIGDLFLNALSLVVIPLVISSVISGIARLADDHHLAQFGLKTIGFFLLTNCLAVLVGLSFVLWFQPGVGLHTFFVNISPPDLIKPLDHSFFSRISQLLFMLIPKNVVKAASEGQILGLVFFSVLFGIFTTKLKREMAELMQQFWQAIFHIMMKMTELVMQVLPIGVFGLIAKVAATTGVEAVKQVSLYFFVTIAALAVFFLLVLPALLALFGRPVLSHFRAMGPALLTAFTTSSTAATLPVTLECVEKRAQLPNRICSFVLPLGVSLNLAGSALFVSVAVVFLAQVAAHPLSISTIGVIAVMSVFAASGMVAGVPSASLISIVIVLETIGMSIEGIALLLIVDRLLDMCRTAVTVFTNSCVASLVSKDAASLKRGQ